MAGEVVYITISHPGNLSYVRIVVSSTCHGPEGVIIGEDEAESPRQERKVPNKEEIHHWIGLVVRPKSDGSSLHHPCSASRVLRQCYRNDRTKEKHMNVVET